MKRLIALPFIFFASLSMANDFRNDLNKLQDDANKRMIQKQQALNAQTDELVKSIQDDLGKQQQDYRNKALQQQEASNAQNAAKQAYINSPLKYYVKGKEVYLNADKGRYEYVGSKLPVNPSDLDDLEMKKGGVVVK